MFHVPTYLARSRIHGVGVFTSVAIPAGTVIWDFTPNVDWRFSPEELDAFPHRYKERLRAWCYLEESGSYVLCGDNAKFMNHSEEPNCDEEGAHTIAARDIAAREELTCDYRSFDVESRDGNGEAFLAAHPAGKSTFESADLRG
jgi:SET domain-containing protein